jgi:hypothetical protein
LKKIVLIPLFLLAFSFVVAIVWTPETFTVPPGRKIVRTVDLNDGDRVSGSLSVVGGSGNDINFHVTDPDGNRILRHDRVTQTDFSFSASMTGTYRMHFDNSFSIFSSKSVTLEYTVMQSLAGIPIFLLVVLVLVVIVVVAVVVVAVIVLTRRKE